jgi:hypothetical protein
VERVGRGRAIAMELTNEKHTRHHPKGSAEYCLPQVRAVGASSGSIVQCVFEGNTLACSLCAIPVFGHEAHVALIVFGSC